MGLINQVGGAIWTAWHGARGLLRAGTPDPSDDFWYADIGGGARNHAGVVITPDIALKASAVYTCVATLAEVMASMPCEMFMRLADGGSRPAVNHPLDELIHYQPNDTQTAFEFWQMIVLHAALRGTGYAEIVPGPRGAVDRLLPIHAARVTTETLKDGSLRYRVTDPNGGPTRTLLQEEMFRVPGLTMNGVTGLKAVDVAAEDIGLGMAGDAYAARVFSNNLNIGGYLKHPKQLSTEAQKNLIQAFAEKLAGIRNAHRPIVLQEGMEFIQGSMVAKDAQLLEARTFQIKLIAMRWRIPLFMLGLENVGAEAEQQVLAFVKFTLRPWAKRIEQAIRRDLIVARGTYFARFNMEALLRGDSKSRSEYFSKALGSGGSPAWMTQAEVRAVEGLNPIDDPRAYVLGVGTNPRTDQPAAVVIEERRSPRALPAPALDAKTEDDKAQDAKTMAGRVVGKHIAATRKAVRRFANDREALNAWAKAFFGGEVHAVQAGLGLDKEAAKAFCDGLAAAVRNADDVNALLDDWQETGAAEIAALIEGNDR